MKAKPKYRPWAVREIAPFGFWRNFIANPLTMVRWTRGKNETTENDGKPVESITHLPSGLVHLRVVIEGPDHEPPCTVRLTMRAAAQIIYVEQTAEDPLSAYDAAVKALLGELNSMKNALGGGPA
ncbi:MAG: hypothetical protein JWM88_1177 [Verrucomicrobia bacterium]|nr:hypothetical protein [Verrucomicrobiota bacterium]